MAGALFLFTVAKPVLGVCCTWMKLALFCTIILAVVAIETAFWTIKLEPVATVKTAVPFTWTLHASIVPVVEKFPLKYGFPYQLLLFLPLN